MTEDYETLFNKFWELYPLHIHKRYAKEIFIRRCKQGYGEDIMKATRGYLAHLKHCRINLNFDKFPMHPSTFLNKERWRDYLDWGYKPPK